MTFLLIMSISPSHNYTFESKSLLGLVEDINKSLNCDMRRVFGGYFSNRSFPHFLTGFPDKIRGIVLHHYDYHNCRLNTITP